MGKDRDSKPLTTTREVMAQLGGPVQVSKLTGAKYKTVWSWSSLGNFPSCYFFLMSAALEAVGRHASPELWGQVIGAAEVQAASRRTGLESRRESSRAARRPSKTMNQKMNRDRPRTRAV
jgi:hypothetical protein